MATGAPVTGQSKDAVVCRAAMNERVRMQYLEALGITMYVPRFVLPEAKASVQALLPSAESAVQDSPRSGEVKENAFPAAAPVERLQTSPTSIGSLMRSLKEEATSATQRQAVELPEPLPQKSVEAKTSGRDVKFSLRIWQAQSDLLIVDSYQPRQAGPAQALLANMLFAVGKAGELGPPELLVWPLLPQIQVAPLNHARDMVSAFLAGRAHNSPVKALWLMGEAAHLACIDADESFAQALGEARQLHDLSARAVVLPSLAEMLQEPARKAVAWRALKSFYGLT